MAEFSNKILTVEYMDPEYTLLKVRYDQDGTNVVYNMSTNPDNQDYKDLLAEGWDHEKIVECTAESKRSQARAYNTEINFAALKIAREMVGMQVIQEEKEKLVGEVEKSKKELLDLDQTAKIRSKTVNSELYEYIFDENSNKEELFKAKLWALELEVVKSADKDIKSSIRKATRITQVLGIIDNLVK